MAVAPALFADSSDRQAWERDAIEKPLSVHKTTLTWGLTETLKTAIAHAGISVLAGPELGEHPPAATAGEQALELGQVNQGFS